MIEFSCSQCRKKLKVRDDAAGKRGKCPQCGAVLNVPHTGHSIRSAEGEQHMEAAPRRAPVRRAPVERVPVRQTPPLEQGHVRQALSVNVHMPKRTSSLGVVSLILGVVAFLLCWIPLVGLLSIPLSALGLLLGAIGLLVALTRRGSGIGYSIGGGFVSGLALAIGIAQVAAVGSAVSGVAEAMDESDRQQTRTNQEVVASASPGGSQRPRTARDSGGPRPTKPPAPAANRNDKPAELEWASAKSAVRQGDVELRITRVVVGKVPLRAGFEDRETTSQDELLAIHVELTNRSQSKKVEYRSWLGRDVSFTRDYATLKDNFGNGYKRISFGFGTDIIGHTGSESIYPGKALDDVLIFEIPVDSAEYLDLELPAKNFGGDGVLRLRIPKDMIHHR